MILLARDLSYEGSGPFDLRTPRLTFHLVLFGRDTRTLIARFKRWEQQIVSYGKRR